MELATPGSAVRRASVARHVTDCATRPGEHMKTGHHRPASKSPIKMAFRCLIVHAGWVFADIFVVVF